ncbi:MAG: phosphogluconate dehydrogenase (NADP(+)-dependent, decarboxylating) [Candidatus Magasanikbacteria bacterium CG10_big_fil_rev_8_21_14_0_10_47_10]|uniref:6-phosphogluconate dehydrogenase, decarboxylating n=1 Tax=Candidatus Magasanikbacteria bacterium CG10_big_fil_rev_8_21_14_0_10_47_10 TaxID=1974652 RepID=A0A2H0TQ56_9BACT|nr:MAG: phosphogluconate dehydrogenase (NADP(+)-dependent, decarboxylating) [Candidatus Magasanikbacteria bacterium CG10_big_fil_rev_8_21_14_0_10_47_10]
MKKDLSQFGIVGLGTMGSALARNIESRGLRVSVYNRHADKTAAFLKSYPDSGFTGSKSLRTFALSLATPRKIMLMVDAGPAVDAVIASLLPHLQKGDIIVDGGNSHYRDTQRREKALSEKSIFFIGCGVSGGEEGALKGPSLMPGGNAAAYKKVAPVFKAIAAKDFSGEPCVTRVGANGAGHYVKMVHNGIEYGIMQLLAETYHLLSTVYGMPPPRIAQMFASWNRGKHHSYLFEIVQHVLLAQDDTKKGYLINAISDVAAAKGTGMWASLDALDRGVPVPTITEAVYARYISADKTRRAVLQKKYSHSYRRNGLPNNPADLIGDALYAAIISTFAQGYDLIARAAQEEKWQINLAEISRIWEGGCIIRAKLLKTFHAAFAASPHAHLFETKQVQSLVQRHAPKLALFVSGANSSGIPLPAFSSSLYYYESIREHRLPSNLIQGLRDYFGAHGFERTDRSGTFHADWK